MLRLDHDKQTDQPTDQLTSQPTIGQNGSQGSFTSNKRPDSGIFYHMQKILFTWEYEMSRLDSNKSSSFPRPLVGSSSTSRPLPRPLNAAPLPPTGKAWMLYICTQSNLIRHSDMVTRSTTGCSGKIVFFHNPLQPILRLHIAARDF